MYEQIVVERREAIATVTVNRPEKLNAIDEATASELLVAFRELENDESVQVIILTGAGDRAFIAGGDIAAMSKMNMQEGERFVYLGHRLTHAIEHNRNVVIAAVNGYALGGGTELALACDLRLASEKAQFGLPEVSVGLFPGWGGTQRLGRLVGKGRAKELVFTGDRIDAAKAEAIGLVNRVVAPEKLMAESRAMAKQILRNSMVAVRQAKKVLNEGLEASLDQGLVIEAEAWLVNFSAADRVEGLTAFVEKRQPQWSGR